MLPQCPALSLLSLSSNQIGVEGVGWLVEVLPQCRVLSILALAGNQLGAEGVARLAGVLPQVLNLLALLAPKYKYLELKALLDSKECCRRYSIYLLY